MPPSRQLAAIMFTDIVGYTALMGEDEQKAFDLLRKNRQLQKPIIEKFNGTWIKEIGDGILASFVTVTDAVLCASEIQKACHDINDLKLRIGIHQSEVVFENNDVFGDGVNIASRLQAIAPIGAIWASEAVHKNISNKKGINSKFVGEETLKNVKEPVRIYEVSVENFAMDQFKPAYTYEQPVEIIRPTNVAVQVKEKTSPEPLIKAKEKKYIKRKHITWIASAFVLVLLAFLFIPRWINTQKARNEWIPEIQKLAEASYSPSTKAFDLAKEAEKYIPKDSALLKLWPTIADPFTFQTNPAGAVVYWKDYNDTSGEWKLIGKTPLKNVWIPRGFTQIKMEKAGFITVLCPRTLFESELNIQLDSVSKLPENMVKVTGSSSQDNIIGLEKYAGRSVNDFLIDKYEVTNKEYKRFVDAGGYRNKTYWEHIISSESKEIPWEQAMSLFVDETGKAGPAGWEVGTYPDGKENHPVTGISWYEAVAYAKFAGKKLPTVYHWSLIANAWNASDIIQKSNFNGTGTVPVGSLGGISWWGVYDIAGNVREWCFNETYRGQRFILGAGWNDPPEDYNSGFTQSAIDRSLSNGFRCMKELAGDTTYNKFSDAVNLDFRDYDKEKPVDNETFAIFLRQYAYDQTALNPEVTIISDSGVYKLEKIDMDAAYNKERLTAYLYLPKNVSPPYQTVIFFPGSSVFHTPNFINDNYYSQRVLDFILKSGRAVLFPVIKGSYERGEGLRLELPEESMSYKNHVIWWIQDVRRSLDYLDTRNDIVHEKFGFFSFSWGSIIAPIVCAVEKRVRTAVFHAPGLVMQKTFPETDPFNFLPQIQIPVLMLNGKNDPGIPLETSLNPLFRLIGTDEKDKKKIVYEGGHLVPRSELMKESLAWFDKYLGPVK